MSHQEQNPASVPGAGMPRTGVSNTGAGTPNANASNANASNANASNANAPSANASSANAPAASTAPSANMPASTPTASTPDSSVPQPQTVQLPHITAGHFENSLRGRLGIAGAGQRLLPRAQARAGWLVTLATGLVAALVRFVGLAHPHQLIFDETYYVKGANSLLRLGYEADWEGGTENDALFAAGDYSMQQTGGDYVVHPPLGKWIMAAGQALFGQQSAFGWRFATALIGVFAVMLLVRVALRLFRSPTLAGFAGLAMALDGMGIVLSRTGLLDNILAFFILAGFWAILRDREATRATLAQRVARSPLRRKPLSVPLAPASDAGKQERTSCPAPRAAAPAHNSSVSTETAELVPAAKTAELGPDSEQFSPASAWGPAVFCRPWLLVAGLLFGMACGVKWSGFYAVAVGGILVFAWGCEARRSVGVRRWFSAGIFREGLPAFLWLVPTTLLTYLAAWLPWFTNPHGFMRSWTPAQVAADMQAYHAPQFSFLPQAFNNWLAYHAKMMEFHTHLSSEHTYMSQAWEWPLQLRPVSFYWVGSDDERMRQVCQQGHECVEAITSIGNIAVWWPAVLALGVVLFGAFWRRDWRAWTILAGYAATWLPWFLYANRTIFQFYAVALLPFTVLALTYGIAFLTGSLPAREVTAPVTITPRGRRIFAATSVVIVLFAAFWYPIWTGMTVPRWFWQAHMWLSSWI
ncbi:dolichyl-phosphate-mannose--protein mannosyltransferase [Actinobaculum suis]|uniref:Polyprenol-phosphate-mannose--protein mannosyltransferase n=2 Tax=Actinobaculum suis TaxID=1657 RepID=A0AAW9HTA5_9ACTO|nr:phospholipid carrier-dependent glycosyltransferase [Actinobaculum suis]MDY5153625.1 phospholipid carrier-dependent glycosyltransferase [Actinobaculum suis]